jgi:hypothetical protein
MEKTKVQRTEIYSDNDLADLNIMVRCTFVMYVANYATKITVRCTFSITHLFKFYPTKNPLSLESDKGFGLYIESTGLRLREDSSSFS